MEDAADFPTAEDEEEFIRDQLELQASAEAELVTPTFDVTVDGKAQEPSVVLACRECAFAASLAFRTRARLGGESKYNVDFKRCFGLAVGWRACVAMFAQQLRRFATSANVTIRSE